MNLIRKNYILFLLLVLCLSSCVKYKSIINYNEDTNVLKQPQIIGNYTPITIQPNDILQIEVVSIEEDAVILFNNYQENGYLVGPDGNIDFPLLGQVNVKEKTTSEARKMLLEGLTKYFVEAPIINLRIANFTIHVNGEVNRPGSFTISNERLSVIEAVTQAGDFTPYARRDSILIIREVGNTRMFGYVNFNSADIFNSPYFYLRQNDVIYIMPDKSKLGTIRERELKYVPFLSIGISVLILGITIFNL